MLYKQWQNLNMGMEDEHYIDYTDSKEYEVKTTNIPS